MKGHSALCWMFVCYAYTRDSSYTNSLFHFLPSNPYVCLVPELFFPGLVLCSLMFVCPNGKWSKQVQKHMAKTNESLPRTVPLTKCNHTLTTLSGKYQSPQITQHISCQQRSLRMKRNGRSPQSVSWWLWMAACRHQPQLWHPLQAKQPRQHWAPGPGSSAASGSRRCWSRCPLRGCSAQMTAREKYKCLTVLKFCSFASCNDVKGGLSFKKMGNQERNKYHIFTW